MKMLQSRILQEGIWNSKTVSFVAQRVMSLEDGTQFPLFCGLSDKVQVRQVLAKFEPQEKLAIFYQLPSGWMKECFNAEDLLW
jgi:hypothetical protein